MVLNLSLEILILFIIFSFLEVLRVVLNWLGNFYRQIQKYLYMLMFVFYFFVLKLLVGNFKSVVSLQRVER